MEDRKDCRDQFYTLLMKREGRNKIEVAGPKWQFMNSHAARRSFATNLFKAGVPVQFIMKITGHSSESFFYKYIKIKPDENAQLVLQHAYFQEPVAAL